MKYVASIFLLVAVAAGQNPVVRTGTTGVVDLSSASATQPARKGAGAPSGPCIQGEQYFRTDAAAGQNLYFCSSADNWTQMAAGGGGNPVGVTDPVSCAAGQLFFNTTEGLQKTCSASNIWTPLREVVSGAGIGVVNSGSTTSVSIDTAVILSQATAQQATPWVLVPTGNSGSAYTACPTPSLTTQPATGSPWILYPDVINEDNATLNICSQGALGLQIILNGGLINVRAGDLRPSVPYVILKGPSTYIATRLETASPDADFSIAFIPDIQNMTESYPAVLDSMMTWVKDNRFAWNIKAVVGGGDMTNAAGAVHMATARSKWDIIKNSGDLVYVPFMGNHDYDANTPSNRLTTVFDGEFGPSYFSGKSWYGASSYPASSNANYYVRFTAGSRKILILVMELFPRAAAVSWAQGVLNANLDHEVILATHGYLNQDGTRTLDNDLYGPVEYGLTADNSGQELWDNLIKAYKNIRMVYCDHQLGPPKHARWSDAGANGNIIHQMFTNYQLAANGGDGWIALLKFRPSKGTVEVSHYRTYVTSGLGFDSNFPTYSLPYERVTPDTSVIESNSPTAPFRSGTTPPARCAPKIEMFIDTDAAAQQQILVCNAAGNGWTAIYPSTTVQTTATQALTNKTLTLPVIGAYTVAGLPAAGTANRVAIVTDAATRGSCTSGGGSYRALCRDTGSAWESLGDGGEGGAGGGYTTIEDEAGALTQRTTVNFTGAGVTCSDTGSKTQCSIPGGGGSGTRSFSILGDAIPDTSGNVFWELYSVKATNDRWGHGVWIFNDTSTDLKLSGTFEVPSDYSGTAKIYVTWTSTATTGNVEWMLKYRAVGGDDAESLDQTGEQESLTVNDAAPAAAHRRLRAVFTLTPANLAAGDLVQWELVREGSDTTNDTMAAAAVVAAVSFEYTN